MEYRLREKSESKVNKYSESLFRTRVGTGEQSSRITEVRSRKYEVLV